MRLFILVICILPLTTFSQVNLLVNGGFEEENICSEYIVNCAPEAWIYTVPSFIYYFKDEKIAYDGSHFVALIAGHANKPMYRTYVRSRLLCGLQKGKTYHFQCYVKSRHPILDSIGVYFSSNDFLYEKRPYYTITPSMYFINAIQKPVRGDTSWQRVTFNYSATGSEEFIALGNFKKKDITGSTGIDREKNFFVLFDDVSLTPTDPKEILCSDWQKTKAEIYAQDERHEFLERSIQYHRTQPPASTPLSPTKILHIDTLIVPEVLFATNSFVLNKQAVTLLDSFTRKINAYHVDSVVVNGHTDATGTGIYNKELSFRRAASVAAYLEKTSKMNIISNGFGSERPVADNRTAAGKQKNRRVEIFIYIRD